MKTRRGSVISLYFLLAITVCAAFFQGTAFAQRPKDLFDSYYGGAYIQKNTAIDSNGRLVGYGFDGSPSNHNKSSRNSRSVTRAHFGVILTTAGCSSRRSILISFDIPGRLASINQVVRTRT